jgi:hypothetical protein
MIREPDSEWSLLAKYLVNEVTEEEKLIVETLLKGNEDLRNDFRKLMAVYYFHDNSEPVDSAILFENLNSRIKNNH